MNRGSSKTVVLLKGASLALNVAYSFGLVFILVRLLPASTYAIAVVTSAMANYVLAGDLGYSVFVFSRVRRSFDLADGFDRRRFISDAVTLYVAAAAVASAIATTFIMVRVEGEMSLKVALSLFFFNSVMSLPWTLARRAGAGLDLYVEFELVELIRRVVFLAAAASMLAGVSFLWFGLICLFCWTACLGSAHEIFRRSNAKLSLSGVRTMWRHIATYGHEIRSSTLFTILEFSIYNFPYVLIPLVYTKAVGAVVVFDVFYKITRFGQVSYGVFADSYLPRQARAYYDRDQTLTSILFRRLLLMSLGPFLVASVAILFAGEMIFTTLLNGTHPVEPSVRVAMVVMLFGLLIRTVWGELLVGLGAFKEASWVAAAGVGAMSAWTLVASAGGWSFDVFICGYALIFAAYAGLFARGSRTFVTRGISFVPA